jgi:hypothetical protein
MKKRNFTATSMRPPLRPGRGGALVQASQWSRIFPNSRHWETLQRWTCFDADSGKDLAVEVREYFIPDFSNSQDYDSFEAAFARSQADLKTAEWNCILTCI